MKQFQRMPDKGVFASAPADAIDPTYASDAINVRFRFGSVFNRPGTTEISSIASQPLWIGRFFTDTSGINTVFAVMLTDTGMFKLVGSVWTAITTLNNAGVAGNIPGTGRYGIAIGEGKLFFTRKGMNNVQYWDGLAGSTVRVTDSSTFAGFPGNVVPGARFLEYFNNRLIEGFINNPADQSTRINWSRGGNTGNWDPTSGGGGGFLDLNTGAMGDEQAEPFTGLRSLAGRLTCYKRHSILDVSPTGISIPIFTSEVRVRGIGCAAPYTLVNVGQAHFFVGDDNVYSWDGVQLRSIGDPIQKRLLQILDNSRMNSYFGALSVDTQEYYLGFQNGIVAVYDYARDYWVFDQYPSTTTTFISALGEADRDANITTWTGVFGIVGIWTDHGEAWTDLSIAGSPALFGGGPLGVGTFDTFFFDKSTPDDYDGSSPNQTVATKRYYFNDDPTMLSEINRVMFRYGANNVSPTTLTIIGTLNTGDVGAAQTLTLNSNGGYSYADLLVSGSPIQFVFATSGGMFEWQSFSFEVTPMGQTTQT